MSISGFPGEDVDTHLKIHGHLPEMECYNIDEPPIVCNNPNYTPIATQTHDVPKYKRTKPSPYAGKRAWKNWRTSPNVHQDNSTNTQEEGQS